MKPNKTILSILIGLLLIGIMAVGASTYLTMSDRHEVMTGSADFDTMHEAMLAGRFDEAASYHESLGIGCPVHDLVASGEIPMDEFEIMHGWMMDGDIPEEKPDSISQETWEYHTSHHSDGILG